MGNLNGMSEAIVANTHKPGGEQSPYPKGRMRGMAGRDKNDTNSAMARILRGLAQI